MISIKLDKELEIKLNEIEKITKKPKSFFIKEAIREYLEDVEDMIEAYKRYNSNNKELLTLEEFKKLADV